MNACRTGDLRWVGDPGDPEDHLIVLGADIAAVLAERPFHLQDVGAQPALDRDLRGGRDEQVDGLGLHEVQRRAIDRARGVVLGDVELVDAAQGQSRRRLKDQHGL
jgi:hypothetical protein